MSERTKLLVVLVGVPTWMAAVALTTALISSTLGFIILSPVLVAAAWIIWQLLKLAWEMTDD